jgi:AcrR family transcriptional regulator
MQVRKQIIDTAIEMFLEEGFKTVTMDDIAQKMAISKKTIYAHFNTKTKLIEASVRQLIEEILEGIQLLKDKNYNPIEEIFQMKKYTMEILKNEQSAPQFQLKKYYPKIYLQTRKQQFEIMQQFVTRNLESGITSGHYRSNLPISFISRIHFAGMLAIKDLDLFPQEEYSTAKLLQYYLEYHLNSICNEKGREALNQYQTNFK